MNQTALTLYELNNLVSATIASTLPNMFWVEAELMEVREVNGHCYMELVQKDVFSATPVARASAKCWRTQWMKVNRKFQQATGTGLRTGMKLLAKVKVECHPLYGYSLIVNDIDPTYTLGDMARKRKEILAALEEEGVLDLQHELLLPAFCKRIAVISSATAAGYGDFCNQLTNNELGVCFEVTLFQSVMQGMQIEESVIASLNAIAERIDEFDCVVMIRGGGAVSDMSGFDTLLLAENVANFPLPIITGIGHERDECVLDIISFKKVKTPTAAAAFLIDHAGSVLERVEGAGQTIAANVAIAIERRRTVLNELSNAISSASRLFRTKQESRIDNLYLHITSSLRQHITVNQHRLQLVNQRINALDPKQLLKRGYSITLANGKAVTDASKLSSGQEIETIFAKGKAISIIK